MPYATLKIPNPESAKINDIQWQPFPRATISSGIIGERLFPHPFIVWQQLSAVGQNVLDNFAHRFAFAKPLQDEHPDRDAGCVNSSRSGWRKGFEFLVGYDGSEHLNCGCQFQFRQHTFIFRHDLKPDIKAANQRFVRERRKCRAKNSLAKLYF